MCCLISKYLEIFCSFFMSSAIPFLLGNILYMTFNLFQYIETSSIIWSILVNAPLAGEKNVCSAVAV